MMSSFSEEHAIGLVLEYANVKSATIFLRKQRNFFSEFFLIKTLHVQKVQRIIDGFKKKSNVPDT